MKLGTIAEIYRYPVKSMLGESLDAVTLRDAEGEGGTTRFRDQRTP